MKPKNIVVTGGNSGIGLQTITALYEEGHNVIFGARSKDKNQQAITQITKKAGGKIKAYQLDLSQHKSIQQFVNNVKTDFSYIDILINNAALVIDSPKQNSELGYQMTLTVNHFGPFYLTYLLWNLLLKSEQARVINVSSNAHTFINDDFLTDLECTNKTFRSFSQYSISKIFNVLFTQGLHNLIVRNNIKNVRTACLHPGFIDTNLGGQNCLSKMIKCLLCCCMDQTESGSRTSLHLVHVPFNQIRDGEYYDKDTRWKDMDARARNQDNVNKLWKISQNAYKIKFG